MATTFQSNLHNFVESLSSCREALRQHGILLCVQYAMRIAEQYVSLLFGCLGKNFVGEGLFDRNHTTLYIISVQGCPPRSIGVVQQTLWNTNTVIY